MNTASRRWKSIVFILFERTVLLDSRLRGNDGLKNVTFSLSIPGTDAGKAEPDYSRSPGHTWAIHDPRHKEEDCRA
jgi:hypothetical protein